MTQLWLAAEKCCNKFYDGNIDFSPRVNKWLNRLWIYRWMARHKQGKLTDPRNLYRACRRYDVQQPSQLSIEDIAAWEVACMEQLAKLRKAAPKLR